MDVPVPGIKGRVFSVTGGTSGMGLATVRMLASLGAAEVWVADWNVSKGDEIAADLAAAHPETKVHITKVDVSDPRQVDAWFSDIVSATGGLLHGSANVAGLPQTFLTPSQPALLHQDDESWARVIGVNLSGVMYCTRAAVREMVKMPKGSKPAVVNVSSIGAFLHGPGCYAYGASKAACSAFTSSVAKDVYSFGIRVNAVCPGNTLTAMTKEFFAGLDEDALKASIGSVGAPAHMLDPSDIARAIVFLLSEQSPHINGVNLPVGEGMP